MDSRRAALPAKLHFSHERVVAPMVGCSDLAFRMLCRKYGADLCYTEMLDASRLITDPAYAASVFWSQLLPPGSDDADRPLIAQLSGRDPDTLVAAARLIEARVDAIDLNLGCPQAKAKEGGCARAKSGTA
jgi:tRNA-dihydrouridine synthase 1